MSVVTSRDLEDMRARRFQEHAGLGLVIGAELLTWLRPPLIKLEPVELCADGGLEKNKEPNWLLSSSGGLP